MMRHGRSLGLTVVRGWLACFAIPALPVSAQNLAQAGKLIVIGGGKTSSRVSIRTQVEKYRIPGKPIGIISTGTEDALERSKKTAAWFQKRWGGKAAVAIPLGEDRDKAYDPEVVELIEGCGGFYFTGGWQGRTSQMLLEKNGDRTPALHAMWNVYLRGGVIAGSSAGAAIMSHPMISGGHSGEALLRGATPYGTRVENLGVEYMDGLGFHPDVLYDQHHLERGRFGRLLAALHSHDFGQKIGVGIAEDTALLVDPSKGIAKVIGARGVVIVDATKSRRSGNGAITGVVVHYLDKGDLFHFPTRRVKPSPGKRQLLSIQGEPGPAVEDPWDENAVWEMIQQLAHSGRQAKRTASDDHVQLTIERTLLSKLWWQPPKEKGDRTRLTLTQLHVSVRPN